MRGALLGGDRMEITFQRAERAEAGEEDEGAPDYPDGFHHGHDTFEERDGER